MKPGAEAYRLHVLGTRDLRAPDGSRVSSVLAQPKRLCLLTYLALAPGPVSRSTLAAVFWPESDESRARNALSQALHYLRRSLGEDVVVNVEGDSVATPPDRLWCDARALLGGRGTVPAALVSAAERDVLEGWNAEDSQPLQEWLDGVRRKVREKRGALLAARADAGAEAAESTHTEEVWSSGRGGAEPEPAEGAVPAATRRADHPRFRRGHRWIAAAALTAAAVAALFLTTIARPSSTRADQTVMVLLPRVDNVNAAVEVSAATIHDELLAHLHGPSGYRVVPVPYFASIAELQRQTAALEELAEPAWVVEVTAVVVGREAKVLGFLHRGPPFELAGVTSTFLLTLDDERRAHLELPPEIGRRVSAMVGRVLAERR